MHRRISLIVTTHDRPEALDLLLGSVARQTKVPHEVLVCDDGSGPTTRIAIDRWRDRLLCDLRHVWQPREGSRTARVRNLGVAAATGDYIVALDGDVLLEADFVADHAAAARLGQWVQGVHTRLSSTTTAALFAAARPEVAWWRPRAGPRWHAVRSPLLARLAIDRSPRADEVSTCNQAYWRADLIRANGFDERFVESPADGREIAARLEHAGLECVYLKHLAIAYRLWSPARPPTPGGDDERLLTETLRTRATRAPVGLDVHGIAA